MQSKKFIIILLEMSSDLTGHKIISHFHLQNAKTMAGSVVGPRTSDGNGNGMRGSIV